MSLERVVRSVCSCCGSTIRKSNSGLPHHKEKVRELKSSVMLLLVVAF